MKNLLFVLTCTTGVVLLLRGCMTIYTMDPHSSKSMVSPEENALHTIAFILAFGFYAVIRELQKPKK